MPSSSFKKNCLLTALSLFATLLCCELLFRLYLKDDYGFPTHRNWRFTKAWDQKYAKLNSSGFRDRDFSLDKPANVFRVLAIGDSMTWGEGVKSIEDLYTEVLEKKLNRGPAGMKFEVLNMSRRGWNAAQYLGALTKTGMAYQPDIVVIGFYINDIELNKSNRPRQLFSTSKVHQALAKMSYLYWYSYSAFCKIRYRKEMLDYFLSYTDPGSADWLRFEAYWKRLIAECSDMDIPVIVAIMPYPGRLDDTHPFLHVYRNVEALSRKHGAAVLNLFPFLKGRSSREIKVGLTDGHPSKTAHKIFADALFDFMTGNELLPRGQAAD